MKKLPSVICLLLSFAIILSACTGTPDVIPTTSVTVTAPPTEVPSATAPPTEVPSTTEAPTEAPSATAPTPSSTPTPSPSPTPATPSMLHSALTKSELVASLSECHTIKGPSGTWLQGGCMVGNIYYQGFVSSVGQTERTTLARYSLSDKSITMTRNLKLDHCNDMTYNSRLDRLVVCHNKPNYKTISFIDLSTMEVVDSRELDFGIFAIDHNPALDRYVVGISGTKTFGILDSELKLIAGPFDHTPAVSQCTNQSVTSDEKYIYFLFYKPNLVAVYTWSGEFVSVIDIGLNNSTMEPESMGILDGKLYINIGIFYKTDTKLYVVDALK